MLDVITKHKSYITDHGKQLAESFPEETYKIYNEYILEEAKKPQIEGNTEMFAKLLKTSMLLVRRPKL